jgi:hypothetical protein
MTDKDEEYKIKDEPSVGEVVSESIVEAISKKVGFPVEVKGMTSSGQLILARKKKDDEDCGGCSECELKEGCNMQKKDWDTLSAFSKNEASKTVPTGLRGFGIISNNYISMLNEFTKETICLCPAKHLIDIAIERHGAEAFEGLGLGPRKEELVEQWKKVAAAFEDFGRQLFIFNDLNRKAQKETEEKEDEEDKKDGE